jgi:hypothetical protein
MERPAFLLQMVCLADVVIKAEPLASGLANDVHGQVSYHKTLFPQIIN